jgi:hypothetical protein
MSGWHATVSHGGRCDLCRLEEAWHHVGGDGWVTAAVCCRCFGRLMGGAARLCCEEFWASARAAKLINDNKEEI